MFMYFSKYMLIKVELLLVACTFI